MHFIIAIIFMVALVWLFSGKGNLKRNLQLTVITLVFIALSAGAILIGLTQNIPPLTAAPFVAAIVYWRTQRKLKKAMAEHTEPSMLSYAIAAKQAADQPVAYSRGRVVETAPITPAPRPRDPFATGIDAKYPAPPTRS